MLNKWSLSRFSISVLIALFAIACVLPVLLVIMNSIASEKAIYQYGYSFFPKEFSLVAYQSMFYPGAPIIRSYGISIFITVVGTTASLLITYIAAFSLANKQVKYRNGFALFFFITTVFNAGLVPWYLISKTLHLYDNIWALIIPNLLFSPFHLFIMRNFIQGIPDSLMESAKIDGAKELRIAFQIYLPLSLPVLATITLFTALAYWNDWFNAVMLLNNEKLYPLQMTLFKIQSDLSMLQEMTNVIGETPPSESFQMAAAVVTIGPIILLYPFLQRFLVKGLIIGAVKG